MKDVSKNQYLTKRGDVWHYHRRVPTPLVPVLGKQFIKKSLAVTDLKTAQRLRNAFNVKVDAEFAAAEKAISNPTNKDIKLPQISLAAMTEYMRQHVKGLDDLKSTQQAGDPPEDENQRKQLIMEAEIALQTLKNRDNPNGAAWVEKTSQSLIVAHGASLEDKQIVTEFAEIVRRGLMEVENRKLDRLDDRFDRPVHDTMFDPARTTSVTFGELLDSYWDERLKDHHENNRSAKWSDKVKSTLAFLREAFGSDTPLSAIDDQAVQNVRSLLSRLPPNRNKIYKGLSLIETAEKAKKTDVLHWTQQHRRDI